MTESTLDARIRRLAFAVAWTGDSARDAAARAEAALSEAPLWAARNRLRGITGLIAPTCEGVMQALEGPEDEVVKLLTEIVADPRVAALTVLLREWDRKRMAPGHGLAHLTPGRRERFFHDAADGLPPRPRLDAEAHMAEALAALLQSGISTASDAQASA